MFLRGLEYFSSRLWLLGLEGHLDVIIRVLLLISIIGLIRIMVEEVTSWNLRA